MTRGNTPFQRFPADVVKVAKSGLDSVPASGYPCRLEAVLLENSEKY